MITFHGPMRRAVPWLGTVFIAGIVALAVFDAVRGHRLAIEQTGRELDSQARIIAEQTTRSLQAVDVVLRHVQAQFREGRLAAMTTEQLHAYLREQAVGLVQIDGLAIVNADGALHALSSGHPPPALSVAGNPAFESFRGGPGAGPVFIGPARRSADGTWMFPIARRLEADGGAFAGVVGARGRVEHYQQFYRDIRLGSGTGTALMHIDGTLVARHPPAVPALGQRFALFEELLAAQRAGEAGPLRRASPVDGVDRFAALQTLPDYPVAVVVTRDADVALASWRDQAVNTAVRTLALAALAGLLLALTMRQLSSLQAARDSLESALAASLEDLTRRRTAEAERDRLESQLRQAQKLEAIGTLAGGIAHDFNNILSAMLGYGEMAQKEAPDGSRLRRHVDAAMSAGLRAKSLVERILTFSRSGIGERVPVHVQSVVVEALELVAASLPPGVRLEPQLDAGDSAVLGDATQSTRSS